MNTRQIILIFIMFFFAMLVLSFPLWAEWALPMMKDFLNSAMFTLENWYAFLKFIAGQVAELFMRLLDRYVLKSG
jgi:hypothetical protein